MAKQLIDLNADFDAPVETLFAYLSEHENLAALFAPASVTRLNDGDDSRNGVGSKRRIKIPLSPAIEETNTVVIDNEHIEYRVTNKTPIKNHLGIMRFSSTANGSHLHYTIEFESRIPFAGPGIKLLLGHAIKKGFKKVKKALA